MTGFIPMRCENCLRPTLHRVKFYGVDLTHIECLNCGREELMDGQGNSTVLSLPRKDKEVGYFVARSGRDLMAR